MRIGFAGLGNMGRHMARHLIKAGHDVNPEAATEHLALGARRAPSPADSASTMLPTPRIVEDVMPSGGAGAALAPGAIWVDMSGSTLAAARRVAEEVLDSRGVLRSALPAGPAASSFLAQYGDLAGEMSPVRLYESLAGRDFRLPVPEVDAVLTAS